MARETREDRVVRGMTDSLTEHLLELKHLAAVGSKESEVESWCQSLIKSVLGFSASNGYSVRAQEAKGKSRFDLIISPSTSPDQILIVAEVKKLGANLRTSDFRSGKTQLSEYLKLAGDVRWGILTNGYEWNLYDFKSELISVAEADLRDENGEIDTSSRAVSETAWNLPDFSSYYYESKTWEKLSTEAQALSPESLARSILSIDVVKKIARILNTEHGYRVSVDLLSDKLSDLIENGLDDTVSTWNPAMRADLDRYIRSQKRAAKKSRRKVEESEKAEMGTEALVDNTKKEAA